MSRKRLRLAVFTGGVSSEREVSLKSATQVLQNLSPEKYDIRVVEVAEDGRWLQREPFTKDCSENKGSLPVSYETGVADIDLAFIAMHGTFAEDGRIQSLFDMLGVPYTGSGVLASALGMDKAKTCELVSTHGIVSPLWFELHAPLQDIGVLETRIQDEVGYPCVIKPASSGSSVGVSIVRHKNELRHALKNAFAEHGPVLVQQYVMGHEVTCGVLGNSHQTPLTPLPVVEIVTKSRFFDYKAKYESSETKEICPANLPAGTIEKIQKAAITVHESLGCDGLTRSDFILGQDDVLYFLEINTIPGMTEMSLCPREARAMGISFPKFLDIQIDLALKRVTLRK